MSSAKRKMPPASLLQRRVRPRYEPEPESDIEGDASDAPSEEGAVFDDDEEITGDDEVASGSDEDESQVGSGAEDEELGEEEQVGSDDEPALKIDAAQLSFGALARAQASLGGSSSGAATTSRRKRRASHGSEAESAKAGPSGDREDLKTAAKRFQKPARTSKHAPTEMSSKRQVSRKRDFLSDGTLPKAQARDPRFMPLPSKAGADPRIDEIKFRKAYAFLDEYRESEMAELRTAIKKAKDPREKEKLERALLSMESKKKAQERKDRERKVIEEHRKHEKELVRQGKTPYYLKKQEVKKKVLEETFMGMKKGQRDKAIERRRKKVAGKEKKNLPFARRTAEDR